MLRHPGDELAPGPRVALGQIDAAHGHTARGRLGETEEEARDGALSGSALPDERDRLAGRELEVEPVENEPGSRRDTRTTRPRAAPSASAGLGGTLVPWLRTAGGRVEQLEDPPGGREPVGAGVELRAELAERQVELRREDEHRQPGPEAEAPVDEPHADRDRDERDAERRRQLEHRSRQEADAQRRHRLCPVALADLGDRSPSGRGCG